jgi:hypothetical protein
VWRGSLGDLHRNEEGEPSIDQDLREIEAELDDIDLHAEQVAAGSEEAGSEVNELAYAVHNLVGCVTEILDHVQGLRKS